jgi:hypothetical protein
LIGAARETFCSTEKGPISPRGGLKKLHWQEGSVMDRVERFFAVLAITSFMVLIGMTTFWLGQV